MNCGSRKAELNPRLVRSLNDNGRAIEIAVSGPFIANNLPTTLGAAVEGMGLAQVPAPLATDAVTAGKLVRVLEQFAPMTPGVFLYYPGHRQNMPKLRAFIDHVKRNSDVADTAEVRPMPQVLEGQLAALLMSPSGQTRARSRRQAPALVPQKCAPARGRTLLTPRWRYAHDVARIGT
jgi:hypothetical protein